MQNPKTILCYGDSNTWGFVPGSIDFETYYMERYSRSVRWTGLLQQNLGDNHYVIEEGLNGRTTNVDYKDFPGRNGKTYLGPCLYTHAPIDLVILSLGGNDLKIEFARDAKAIAQGVSELIDIVQNSTFGADMQSAPPILLVHYFLPTSESFQDINGEFVFRGAIEKAMQLSDCLNDLAKEKQCYFVDTTSSVKLSSIDGLHFDETGHKKFAELITREVNEILEK